MIFFNGEFQPWKWKSSISFLFWKRKKHMDNLHLFSTLFQLFFFFNPLTKETSDIKAYVLFPFSTSKCSVTWSKSWKHYSRQTILELYWFAHTACIPFGIKRWMNRKGGGKPPDMFSKNRLMKKGVSSLECSHIEPCKMESPKCFKLLFPLFS